MSTTRAQFLDRVHQPLHSDTRRSSPTKSTYRVRWRELAEWTTFAGDALAYWDNLDDAEQNAVLPTVGERYWHQAYETLNNTTPIVTVEDDLGIYFTLLYGAPHNVAIRGASDDHAEFIRRHPDLTGLPDGCLKFDDRIAGIVEIKTFWNINEDVMREVFQGPSLPESLVK